MAVKAAYIIIFCCLLIHMNAFTTDFAFYRVVNKLGALSMLIPQSITYLLYPFLDCEGSSDIPNCIAVDSKRPTATRLTIIDIPGSKPSLTVREVQIYQPTS